MNKLETIDAILAAFWAKVNKRGPICEHLGTRCWEWTAGTLKSGYGVFGFRGKSAKAHRVAWILCRGGIPDGLLILHKCDNPACVRPSHLFVGNYMDNRVDMLSKGRGIMSRKITPGMATIIRREYLAGYSGGELGVRFRLSKSHIGNVLTGAIFSTQDAELLKTIKQTPSRRSERAGRRNGRAKLTVSQVRYIRKATGVRIIKRLAKQFAVAPVTIGKIRSGELWQSLR